jgi:hypothetical protein
MSETSLRCSGSAPRHFTSTASIGKSMRPSSGNGKNMLIAAAAIEQDYFNGQIRKLSEEFEKERERNRGLVGLIAVMEANAARVGFDPEEMYKPIQKPIRTMSRAGTRKPGSARRRF